MKNLFLISCISLCQTALFAQNCPPSTVKNVHIVQKGETLYSISKQHKTTVAQLCQLNNIQEGDVLSICTALDVVNPVPVTTKSAKPVPSTYSSVPSSYDNVSVKSKSMPYFRSSKRTHVVKNDETFDMIAEYYGYTRARLMYMNNMRNTSNFHVGQEIIVSDCNSATEKTTQTTQSDVPQGYSVVAKSSPANNYKPTNYAPDNYSTSNLLTTPTHSGNMVVSTNYNWNPSYKKVIHVVSQDQLSQKETLESVGRLHGLTGAEVAAMNGLSVNSALIAGQRLIVEERLEGVEASSDGFMSSSSIPSSYNIAPPQYTPSLTEAPAPNNNTTGYLNAASTPTINNTSMTPEEMKMVEEVNAIRRNPAGYIVNVEQYIKNLEKSGNNKTAIAAARELITELFAMPVLSTLQPLECIYSSGKKFGIEQRKRGVAEHQGVDGSMPWDRIMQACPSLKDGNENLVGGPADIREAVMLLLVDDGIPSRGHRRTLLQPNWRYIACHKMGQVGSMPNYWVQQFGN
jgi:LysM repeat protein